MIHNFSTKPKTVYVQPDWQTFQFNMWNQKRKKLKKNQCTTETIYWCFHNTQPAHRFVAISALIKLEYSHNNEGWVGKIRHFFFYVCRKSKYHWHSGLCSGCRKNEEKFRKFPFTNLEHFFELFEHATYNVSISVSCLLLSIILWNF